MVTWVAFFAAGKYNYTTLSRQLATATLNPQFSQLCIKVSCKAEAGSNRLCMRMIHPTYVGSALILLPRLLVLCAVSPADVEVDLVFPVANETYKNASQLWQEKDEIAPFVIHWTIDGYPDETDFRNSGRNFGTEKLESLAKPGPRPEDGVHMVFGSPNSNMINGTQRVFLLAYTTFLSWACSPNNSTPLRPVYASEQITFYLDPEPIRLPDFAHMASSCPVPITNFEFDGLGNSLGERCMKMASTREADPCGLKQNEEDLANRTMMAMLDFAGCPNGTWPDPEGLLGPRFCNAPKNSLTARELSGKLLAMSVLASAIAIGSM
ncbi:hypothetical protein GCG54_00014727 [Colletotrichum gloeosporioides]|uniref:Uncharacterized protein n=1 Tax=Colletotrichum gloeosporioides TaxID=474922 RepID=A0A8H4FGM8_COLGL|nr:uncharacterized protein GCG54_00014727 [Colletotrichum gloeosporioides]KAF3801512.1 hypothetical protein GCG54_00014727 [Colletotrichum gloeosporioides]